LEAVMAEDNSAKISLVTAIIGAVGAIAAAAIPIYLNRPAADPAPAAAKADPAPGVEKPTRESGPKDVAKAVSKAGASREGAHPKGPTAHAPKSESKALPPDLARMQGKWAVTEQASGTKVTTKEDLARTKTTWEFDGNKAAVRNHGDSPGLVYYQGSIKVHPDLTPKSFDLIGKNRQDQSIEMLGIYAFDGAVLILRYRIYHAGDPTKPPRPTSLKLDPDPKAGSLVRLRRVKE
jgi:uncharacterized protein (TIGR03067 family)